MNSSSLSPPEPSTDSAQSAPAWNPVFRPSRAARARRLAAVLFAAALVAALAALWWTVRNDIQDLRNETARRLQSADAAGASAQALLKNLQDSLRNVQGKVSVLESKQAEAQNQQLALEQLYQDLYRNRDEWALTEIEQVLATAAQQLQLAGNVQGAMVALQNADRNLAASDKPQFTAIRRAIANDLERLKALPIVDLTGIALRLDSVIGQVDRMPLLSDEKPVQAIAEPKQSSRRSQQGERADATAGVATDSQIGVWFSNIVDWWQSVTTEILSDMKQLVRVRTVDSPDVLLLSPAQSYFAKENLKLRLLNARLALLSRNEAAFRSDLFAAQQTIGKYFDTRAKQTQTVQSLLRQVQGSNVSIEMPTLAESLTAVREYKAQP